MSEASWASPATATMRALMHLELAACDVVRATPLGQRTRLHLMLGRVGLPGVFTRALIRREELSEGTRVE